MDLMREREREGLQAAAAAVGGEGSLLPDRQFSSTVEHGGEKLLRQDLLRRKEFREEEERVVAVRQTAADVCICGARLHHPRMAPSPHHHLEESSRGTTTAVEVVDDKLLGGGGGVQLPTGWWCASPGDSVTIMM